MPDTRPLPAPMNMHQRAAAYGVRALSDDDLLALAGIARRSSLTAGLIEKAGGLLGLSRLGAPAIADAIGGDHNAATRIAVMIELADRLTVARADVPMVLTTSAQVAAFMVPKIGHLTHEELWVVSLDGKNRVRGARMVSRGGRHGATVYPRDVLRMAIQDGASTMILAHNHPGGDPTPSTDDLIMTRKVADAGDVIGMPLVDHVIIAPPGRYTSFLDLGILAVVGRRP